MNTDMNTEEKNAVVETILTRAAEQLGDITQPVMARFYQRFPQAREPFAHHGSDRVYSLEGEMVEQAVYCLMYWFHSPGEIEILLWGSVPHHSDTLGVPPEFYRGLLAATADIIRDTIPAANSEEREVWKELDNDLASLVKFSSQFIMDRSGDSAG